MVLIQLRQQDIVIYHLNTKQMEVFVEIILFFMLTEKHSELRLM